MTFAGHVPTAVNAGEAADAGQKGIEHLTGSCRCFPRGRSAALAEFAAVLQGAGESTGITERARGPRERRRAPVATYNEATAALFRRFVVNGTVVPTLTVWRAMASWTIRLHRRPARR
jgi:hypothetical protein